MELEVADEDCVEEPAEDEDREELEVADEDCVEEPAEDEDCVEDPAEEDDCVEEPVEDEDGEALEVADVDELLDSGSTFTYVRIENESTAALPFEKLVM